MNKKNIGTEETLYRLGLVAALVAAISFLLWQLVPETLRNSVSRLSFCVIYRLTGYSCPGCGGTRAFTALLHGHLLESFLYHPLVIYGVGFYIVFMGSHMLEKTPLRIIGLKWKNQYAAVAVWLLVGNFVIKNLIHLFTGMDVLAELQRWFAR